MGGSKANFEMSVCLSFFQIVIAFFVLLSALLRKMQGTKKLFLHRYLFMKKYFEYIYHFYIYMELFCSEENNIDISSATSI